jgi:hypothetical protein
MNAYAIFVKNRQEIERDLRSALARHGFRVAGKLLNPLLDDGAELSLQLKPLAQPDRQEELSR